MTQTQTASSVVPFWTPTQGFRKCNNTVDIAVAALLVLCFVHVLGHVHSAAIAAQAPPTTPSLRESDDRDAPSAENVTNNNHSSQSIAPKNSRNCYWHRDEQLARRLSRGVLSSGRMCTQFNTCTETETPRPPGSGHESRVQRRDASRQTGKCSGSCVDQREWRHHPNTFPSVVLHATCVPKSVSLSSCPGMKCQEIFQRVEVLMTVKSAKEAHCRAGDKAWALRHIDVAVDCLWEPETAT